MLDWIITWTAVTHDISGEFIDAPILYELLAKSDVRSEPFVFARTYDTEYILSVDLKRCYTITARAVREDTNIFSDMSNEIPICPEGTPTTIYLFQE